jgi:hypothetical protein
MIEVSSQRGGHAHNDNFHPPKHTAAPALLAAGGRRQLLFAKTRRREPAGFHVLKDELIRFFLLPS